ncbi:glycosyltransferase family 39 protein [Brevibacterium sp. ACRRH]|uniref:glycosyltransferase family 39 protein n=1 Tax=Brevibacterium sp. ACRRH TaxID=2918183 RepID=UPI001EF44249|nr:glycosyltransferase family 39 protein [Brevibacterium sp. ACRRH]MCG7297754.1 glycosyltransferase family 39 protein [Brevibacterium sp. ACRRH]
MTKVMSLSKHNKVLLWDVGLLLLCLAIATVTFLGFYPGRAEHDISEQAKQMLGMKNLSDWHPPIVAILWRGLYAVTGKLGSLLAFQLGIYFLAVFLLAVFAHRILKSKWASLAMIAISVSPWAYSQLNTLWKDTIMAAALLLATGCLALLVPKKKKTYWFVLPAVALLIFATLVRKNAFVAVVPMCVFLAWRLVPGIRWRVERISRQKLNRKIRVRKSVLATLICVVAIASVTSAALCVDAGIARHWKVQPMHQVYQVILDDVMFSVPESELNGSAVPQELKDKINEARPKCYEKGEPYDAYWNCYGKGIGGGAYSPIANRDELKHLWLNHVITHPMRYLEYRWSVYKFYLTTSQLEYNPNRLFGTAKKVGFVKGNKRFESIVFSYIHEWAKKDIAFVFKPWFWLLAGALVSICAWWSGRSRAFALMLTGSAFLYVFAYFPVVPANHFRYTYWPALAVSVAFIAVVAGAVKAWKDRHERAGALHAARDDKPERRVLESSSAR